MSPTPPPLDVLVIGGGQAGLAMGYQLAQRGLNFQIVDAGAEIGDAWRRRWNSLLLFTDAPRLSHRGRVLVVGAANSGCQIAEELSATHSVELSAGQRIPTVPQRPLGRDVWWWATRLGLDRVTVGSRLGRRLADRDQVIGGGPRELTKRHGVRLRPRVTGATGRTVSFADGDAGEFDVVVWATGFRVDHSWIDVPGVKDEQARIRHQRGVTPSPGLYTLGLSWQHTRGSALLNWVGNDAAFLAEQISSPR
jgi:putative flavoprotein involved in K+ transport